MKFATMNFEKEVFNKQWNNYYTVLEVFENNGERFMFGHCKSANHRWFVSKYKKEGEAVSFEEEVASGNWKYFYPSIKIFKYKIIGEQKERVYMFAHSTESKHWFISEFNPKTYDFEHEIACGDWHNAYETIDIISIPNAGKTNPDIYLIAQSENGRYSTSKLTVLYEVVGSDGVIKLCEE